MVEMTDTRLDGHPIGTALSNLAAEIGAQRWVLLWRSGDRWGRLGTPGVRDDLFAMLACSGVGQLDRVPIDDIDEVGARLRASGLDSLTVVPLDTDRPAVAFFEEPASSLGREIESSPWISVALDALDRAEHASELSRWARVAAAIANGTLSLEQGLERLAEIFDLTALVFATPGSVGVASHVLHTPPGGQPVWSRPPCPDTDWRSLADDPIAALGWLPDERVARWSSAFTASDRCSLLALEGRGRNCESVDLVSELLGQSVSTLRSNERRREQIRHTERTRLATTLHEELSQRLSALTIEIDLLSAQRRAADVTDDLAGLRGQVVLALEALRSAIFELAPPEPDWAHLEAGLDRFVEDLAATRGLAVEVQFEGAARPVDAEAISLVFACVQEALSNVAKHAGTASANVRVVFAEEALVIEITDTGAGFTHEVAADRQHQGLAMLRTRARLAGTLLDVESAPESGTTVRLEVPVTRNRDLRS